MSSARVRANTRACQANQRSIAGALELYSLDHELDHELDHVTPLNLDQESLETLEAGGYLQSVPTDPGSFGATDHYIPVPGGNGVLCLRHGAVDYPEGLARRPRDQARALGLTDPRILARIRETAPGERMNLGERTLQAFLIFVVLGLPFTLGYPAILLLRRLISVLRWLGGLVVPAASGDRGTP